jgi:hypothetical protein
LASFREATYNQYSKPELQYMMVERDDNVETLRVELRLLKKSQTHYYEQTQALRQTIVQLHATNTDLVRQLNYRPGIRWVSVFGGYDIALRRASGHAGAKTTLAMLTGGLRGNVTDRGVVYRYEHRAAAAQHLKSLDVYGAMEVMMMVRSGLDTDQFGVIVHCLKCDATKQDALDHEKVVIGTVSTCAYGASEVAAALDNGVFVPERFRPVSTFGACDLQIEVTGTGEETYHIMKQNLTSVGATHWDDRCQAADLTLDALYCFGLDNGPNNSGSIKRVRTVIRPVTRCAFDVNWCFFHQAQLIVLSMVATLDGWHWKYPKGVGYFSGVATIANVVRSTGMRGRIQKAASDGVEVLKRMFGRCLRGRWLSIDSVEGGIILDLDELAAIFMRLFARLLADGDGDGGAIAPPRAAVTVGADEAAAYREQQKNYRQTAALLLNFPLFRAAMKVSRRAKASATPRRTRALIVYVYVSNVVILQSPFSFRF